MAELVAENLEQLKKIRRSPQINPVALRRLRSMEEVEAIARQPNSIPISCTQELNLDTLLEMLWDMMGLVRFAHH